MAFLHSIVVQLSDLRDRIEEAGNSLLKLNERLDSVGILDFSTLAKELDLSLEAIGLVLEQVRLKLAPRDGSELVTLITEVLVHLVDE